MIGADEKGKGQHTVNLLPIPLLFGASASITELQAEGYTAVEDSVLRLLRELMQDRLTPEPSPSQWDRTLMRRKDIRRLLQVHQSLCKQRTASPYFERALQHLEEIICSGVTDKELHFVDSTRENLTFILKKRVFPSSKLFKGFSRRGLSPGGSATTSSRVARNADRYAIEEEGLAPKKASMRFKPR